ncbi:MAG: DUF3726 domain-containing protein [Pseudomonadota bacterium]
MHASRNELLALLKQVYEACGFPYGLDESAAEMTLWAQMHGLNVFAGLAACLSRLQQTSPGDQRFDSVDEQLIEVDANGESMLALGSSIGALMLANTLNSGRCVARLQNCRDRIFVARILHGAGQRNLSCLAAWWPEPAPGTVQLLRTSGDHGLVESSTFRGFGDDVTPPGSVPHESAQSLLLVYASDSEQLKNTAAELSLPAELLDESAWSNSFERIEHIDLEQMQSSYAEMLEGGVPVADSLWEIMLRLSAKVLVESTEISKKGAGPAGN